MYKDDLEGALTPFRRQFNNIFEGAGALPADEYEVLIRTAGEMHRRRNELRKAAETQKITIFKPRISIDPKDHPAAMSGCDLLAYWFDNFCMRMKHESREAIEGSTSRRKLFSDMRGNPFEFTLRYLTVEDTPPSYFDLAEINQKLRKEINPKIFAPPYKETIPVLCDMITSLQHILQREKYNEMPAKYLEISKDISESIDIICDWYDFSAGLKNALKRQGLNGKPVDREVLQRCLRRNVLPQDLPPLKPNNRPKGPKA